MCENLDFYWKYFLEDCDHCHTSTLPKQSIMCVMKHGLFNEHYPPQPGALLLLNTIRCIIIIEDIFQDWMKCAQVIIQTGEHTHRG